MLYQTHYKNKFIHFIKSLFMQYPLKITLTPIHLKYIPQQTIKSLYYILFTLSVKSLKFT